MRTLVLVLGLMSMTTIAQAQVADLSMQIIIRPTNDMDRITADLRYFSRGASPIGYHSDIPVQWSILKCTVRKGCMETTLTIPANIHRVSINVKPGILYGFRVRGETFGLSATALYQH